MQRSWILASALVLAALAGMAGSANGQTVVSSDITTNTTWTGEIVLDNPIFVRDATLTILPNTIVRGQPRSGPVVVGSTAGTPGTLIVERTGHLVADGNSAGSSIIFTTAAVDNDGDGIADDLDGNGFEDQWPGFVPGATPGTCSTNPCTPQTPANAVFLDDDPRNAPLAPLNAAGRSNVALWGGVVVLGNAPTNNADKCGTPYGTCFVEGLTVPGFPVAQVTYGGVEPNDNSGVIRYASIRHAGDEIGNGNELNGLTMGGVGAGTLVEFVEIYANFDDGFEWFGGTVNGSNLSVVFVGDDGIDVDEGYTGINQYVFVVMPYFNENSGAAFGSGSGDKAGEFDGDNYRPDNSALNNNVNTRIAINGTAQDPTPWPLSAFQFWNVTVLGSTPDAGQDFVPVSVASTNRGVQWRNGAAGIVGNSIVVNTGAETGIEIDLGATGAPGFDAIDNVNNGLTALVCSTLDDGDALDPAEMTAVSNGNDLAVVLGGPVGASVNVVNNALFPGLVNEDQTFDPQGVAGKLHASLKPAPIDPRPAPGFVGVAGCPEPPLDPNATFRGAFPAGAPLWTNGWSVLSQGGLL